MSSAFYVPDGGRFVSTELTRGPWDPGAQHAGPPAALLGRELELLAPDAGGGEAAAWFVARVTFEILRPVPIAPLSVEAEVVRGGKRVQLLAATLADDEGPMIRASAWRIAVAPVALEPGFASEDEGSPARRAEALPAPDQAAEREFFATGQEVGYHSAMEYRFVSGSFLEPGPAAVWMRSRVPLVAGEQLTPLQRTLLVADTGNGVSATLDLERYIFINVDLTVHLHRLPAGEWVCLDAITVPEPSGIGLADSALYDERGPIGRALQSLVVRER